MEIIFHDLRQTREYAEFMKKTGWLAEKLKRLDGEGRKKEKTIYVYIRKIPLLPMAVLKGQRWTGRLDFSQLKRCCRKHRVVMAKLEPLITTDDKRLMTAIKEEFKRHRFGQASPLTPSRTIWINLKTSKKTLWRNLAKDARQSIKKAEGLIKIRLVEKKEEETVEKFYEMWRLYKKGYLPKRENFRQLLEAFKEKAFLVTGWNDKELVAGAVILTTASVAYYYFAMTTAKGRRKLAQYLVVWRAILEAKKRGKKIFDLEGIYDRRWPLKRWQGFSFFKQKFGGKEVELFGCGQKWLPIW